LHATALARERRENAALWNLYIREKYKAVIGSEQKLTTERWFLSVCYRNTVFVRSRDHQTSRDVLSLARVVDLVLEPQRLVLGFVRPVGHERAR
jgi:hypothetical protein